MDVEAAVSTPGSSYETGNYGGLFKGEDVTADGCVYDPEVNNGLEKYPTSVLYLLVQPTGYGVCLP